GWTVRGLITSGIERTHSGTPGRSGRCRSPPRPATEIPGRAMATRGVGAMDQTTARAEKLKVTFLPKEVSTRVPAGTTLFHAAAWTGQPVESTCGGRSTCGKCRVLIH